PLVEAVGGAAERPGASTQALGEREPVLGAVWPPAAQHLLGVAQALAQRGAEAPDLLTGERASVAPHAMLGRLGQTGRPRGRVVDQRSTGGSDAPHLDAVAALRLHRTG